MFHESLIHVAAKKVNEHKAKEIKQMYKKSLLDDEKY